MERSPSPDAASEISGTTAFSSFSIIEAETLDADDIRDQLPNLHQSATDLLQYLVPEDGHIEMDDGNLQELQRPGSKYAKGAKRLAAFFDVYLSDFKTDPNTYIRPRAIHRALRPNRDPGEPQFGVDLVIYQANLLVLTHKMMILDRDEGTMWDFLREIDRSFPQHFVPKIAEAGLGSGAGESTLLVETFELALELRTHLAILWLEIASRGRDFNPDDTLNEVFCRTDGTEPVIRGWQVPGLDDNDLSPDQRSQVEARIEEIRAFFDDIDSLSNELPWNSLILQLLQWARLRHHELQTAIEGVGGVDAITSMIKNNGKSPVVPRKSPRKARTSFTKERRRVSGKFNAHDASKNAIIDALIASSKAVTAQPVAPEPRAPVAEHAEDKATGLTTLVNDDDDGNHVEEPLPKEPIEIESAPILGDDFEEPETEVRPSREVPASRPPESSADHARLFNEMRRMDKENRGSSDANQRSFFARQPTAERIEFGDGFNGSQTTAGPSRKGREGQRATVKKRRREIAEDSSDEEDDFEVAESSRTAQARREKAPIKKRVRIEEAPSATPNDQTTSHQQAQDGPSARVHGQRRVIREPSSDLEDDTPPERTEEAARRARKYGEIQELAKRNQQAAAVEREPKRRNKYWTPEAEEAFLEYMEMFPGHRYAFILKYDSSPEGHNVLQGREQVHLKDKARNMAINMIK